MLTSSALSINKQLCVIALAETMEKSIAKETNMYKMIQTVFGTASGPDQNMPILEVS